MKTVFIHFVQMEKYSIPDEIAEKGNQAIEDYIYQQELEPIKIDCRDWEVVDIEDAEEDVRRCHLCDCKMENKYCTNNTCAEY